MNLLFVCTGNTCRSAMAEELMRCMTRQLGIEDLEVNSAGTDAYEGLPASYGACSVIEERGGDLFNHAAVKLTRGQIEDADLILVMENGKIAAQGRHEELLQSSPIYREVYEQQTSGGDEHEAE